ncbi:MAG: hypothetical protein EBR09_05405 [Proteobacteria bacterium]|nr:hypothetical protein [Pseudomonadota bacterium]
MNRKCADEKLAFDFHFVQHVCEFCIRTEFSRNRKELSLSALQKEDRRGVFSDRNGTSDFYFIFVESRCELGIENKRAVIFEVDQVVVKGEVGSAGVNAPDKCLMCRLAQIDQ